MADKPEQKANNKEEIQKKKSKKSKDGVSTPQNSSRTVSRDNTPKLTTPKSSREGTPKTGTPRSSRGNTPRPISPKLPKYQYSKEDLLKFRKSPFCKKIPVCLSKYRDVLPDIILDECKPNLDIQVKDQATGDVSVIRFEDGIDSEGWYKHIHIPRGGGDDSRGNSPLTLSAPRPLIERKPRREIDDGPLFKRKGDDEDAGIVLGPQRKSFDTGCHVSTAAKADSRGVRRIGSGRIAMRHQDSLDDERGRNNGGEGRRELPDLQSLRKQASADRFYRAGESRFTREREARNDDDRRDYGDRRFDDGRRRGYRRFESSEQEPEWFSAGPTSQQDTIELRGFEESRERSRASQRMEEDVVVEDEVYEMAEEQTPSPLQVKEAGEKRPRTESVVSVADRNGSLETNESSSPETSHEDRAETADVSTAHRDDSAAAEIDFMFNLENIPGLSSLIGGENEVNQSRLGGGAMGSRFSQWFSAKDQVTPIGSRGPASRSTSRRSSLNEEFSYLNDMLNGSKSPALASPELDDPLRMMRGSPAALVYHASPYGASSAAAAVLLDKRLQGAPPPPSIMQLLNGGAPANKPPRSLPQGALNVNDVEASLKSLLLAKRGQPNTNAPPQKPPGRGGAGSHALPASARITTVAELEASALERLAGQNQGAEPKPTSDMAAFNRLVGLMKASGTPQPQQQLVPRSSPQPMAPTLNMQQALMQHQMSHPPVSAFHDNTMLQKLIQHQQAQAQQQLSLQAQASKELQLKHLQQQQSAVLRKLTSQAPPTMMSAQTTAMTSQSPGMTSQAGIPGGNVSMRAAAVKSPIPPPLNLQPPAAGAVRAPSPLLQPTSPRAPSPIMFGSQPPMHLTAPAPIHAASSQMTARSPSPNTLAVAQPAAAQRRVPSPAELHTHAQAIMQNALIKKQLEGQKQRFLQKQQHTVQGKSPSPGVDKSAVYGPAASMPGGASPVVSAAQQASATPAVTKPTSVSGARSLTPNQLTSTPAPSMAGLNPAFTPTSVIRKMANDKMEEKEKHASDDDTHAHNAAASKSAPVMRLVSESSTSASVSSASDGKITNSDSQLKAQYHATLEHMKHTTTMSVGPTSIGQPLPVQTSAAVSTSAVSGKIPRALMGQGAMNNSINQQQHNQTPQVAMQQHMQPMSNHGNVSTAHQPTVSSMQLHNHALLQQTMATSSAQPLHNIQQGGGRPIIKAGQPVGLNTLSPPSQRTPTVQPLNNITAAHMPGQPTPPKSDPTTPTNPIPPQLHTQTSQQRAIMGNGGMSGGSKGGMAGAAGGGAQQMVDSVRLAEQARLAQIQAQLQAGAQMQKTGSPYAVMGGGRVPVATPGLMPVNISPQQQQQAAVANALLMQRLMMQPNAGLHPSQVAAYQAAQLNQHQQQQRAMEFARNQSANRNPAVAATSPVQIQGRSIQGAAPMAAGRGIHGQGATMGGGAAAPHGIYGRAPSPPQHTQLLPGGDGLAKFFGNDLLKQQSASMPPLPSHTGQHIMTVEDLERRQQTVTN